MKSGLYLSTALNFLPASLLTGYLRKHLYSDDPPDLRTGRFMSIAQHTQLLAEVHSDDAMETNHAEAAARDRRIDDTINEVIGRSRPVEDSEEVARKRYEEENEKRKKIAASQRMEPKVDDFQLIEQHYSAAIEAGERQKKRDDALDEERKKKAEEVERQRKIEEGERQAKIKEAERQVKIKEAAKKAAEAAERQKKQEAYEAAKAAYQKTLDEIAKKDEEKRKEHEKRKEEHDENERKRLKQEEEEAEKAEEERISLSVAAYLEKSNVFHGKDAQEEKHRWEKRAQSSSVLSYTPKIRLH